MATRLVCFALGAQRFGVRIDAVQEAVPVRPITSVFLVPPFVRGIMNLRGEIIAVIDLLLLLGLDPTQISEHTRVVVVRQGKDRRDLRVAGLLADQLCGVTEVDEAAIQPVPPTLPAAVTAYALGLVSRLEQPLLVLDLERLFHAEPLLPFRAPAHLPR